mmetsp:Transcript_21093/g.64421  ORF Transcript_21093/g.64421 Transcript_21093/m.64421 type:complete len:291 (+) Transcript_21093:864-1736(+)
MKESSPSSSLKSVGATVTSMSPAPEEAMRAGACESLPVEGGDEQDVGRSGTSSLIAVPSCRLLFLLSLPFSTPAGKRLPSLRSNSSLTMKFASEHGSQPLTAGRKATSFGARADSLAEGRWRWARPERNNDESANRASSETIKLFSSRMASEASESSSKTECSLIDGRELRFELVEKPERPEAEDALPDRLLTLDDLTDERELRDDLDEDDRLEPQSQWLGPAAARPIGPMHVFRWRAFERTYVLAIIASMLCIRASRNDRDACCCRAPAPAMDSSCAHGTWGASIGTPQ